MLRTDLEKAQETKRWKNYLSDLNSIPLDENYEYKDVNDPYERLMQHVKSWIESTFGKYTDKDGLLKKLTKEKLTQEGKDWVEGKTRYVSDIKYGWFNAIMKNTKNGKEVIPYLNMEDIESELQDPNQRMALIRTQAISTYMPAYRAIKESFDKRPFWQYFTNHAQYTAERDALKVVKTIMISTMGEENEKRIDKVLKELQNRVPEDMVNNADVPPIQRVLSEEELKKRPVPFSCKNVEPMMFFRKNYIPNINNLKNELEHAKKMDKILNEVNEYRKKGWFARWKERNTPIAKLYNQIKPHYQTYESVFIQNKNRLEEVIKQKPEERGDYIKSNLKDVYSPWIEQSVLPDLYAKNYKVPTASESMVAHINEIDVTEEMKNEEIIESVQIENVEILEEVVNNNNNVPISEEIKEIQVKNNYYDDSLDGDEESLDNSVLKH